MYLLLSGLRNTVFCRPYLRIRYGIRDTVRYGVGYDTVKIYNSKTCTPDNSSTRCRARAAMWALAARRPGPLWRGDLAARPLLSASVTLAATAPRWTRWASIYQGGDRRGIVEPCEWCAWSVVTTSSANHLLGTSKKCTSPGQRSGNRGSISSWPKQQQPSVSEIYPTLRSYSMADLKMK